MEVTQNRATGCHERASVTGSALFIHTTLQTKALPSACQIMTLCPALIPELSGLLLSEQCLAIKQQAIYCSARRIELRLYFAIFPAYSLWSCSWVCYFSLNRGHTRLRSDFPQASGLCFASCSDHVANISSDPARAAPQLVVPGR